MSHGGTFLQQIGRYVSRSSRQSEGAFWRLFLWDSIPARRPEVPKRFPSGEGWLAAIPDAGRTIGGQTVQARWAASLAGIMSTMSSSI